MRHGVVLDPCACHAEAPRQRGRVDERGEPGIEGQRRLAVEREPSAVAPQGGRTAGDRLSGGERTPRLVYRVEGPETLLADRDRSGGALGPAVTAADFFFQAEDGIRDLTVTGVQTCALPI